MDFTKKLVKRDAAGNIDRVGLDLRLSGGGAAGTAQKYWTQVMVPYGAKVIDPVGAKWKVGYKNKAGYDALQYYIDAVYKHRVENHEQKSDAEGFGLGVTSMFKRESWVVGYMRENAPDIDYGTFLMPKGPGGWGNVGNALAVAIPKSSEVKEEALAFLQFLLDDEMQLKVFEEIGWQPPRVNIDYTGRLEKYPLLQNFIKALNTPGHDVLDYENMPAISEIHNRLADRLMPAFKKPELTATEPNWKLRSTTLPMRQPAYSMSMTFWPTNFFNYAYVTKADYHPSSII
jgi:multiple sugar transport system substrate-binding protein